MDKFRLVFRTKRHAHAFTRNTPAARFCGECTSRTLPPPTPSGVSLRRQLFSNQFLFRAEMTERLLGENCKAKGHFADILFIVSNQRVFN